MKSQACLAAVCGFALLAGGCVAGEKTGDSTNDHSKIARPEYFEQVFGSYIALNENYYSLTIEIDSLGRIKGNSATIQNASNDAQQTNEKQLKILSFTSTFLDVYQTDEYTYSTDISEIEYENPNDFATIDITLGESIASFDRFYFFNPETPLSTLPEKCLEELQSLSIIEPEKAKLDHFILYNYDTETVFVPTQKPKFTESSLDPKQIISNDNMSYSDISNVLVCYDHDFPEIYVYSFNETHVNITQYALQAHSLVVSPLKGYPVSIPYHKDGNNIVFLSPEGEKIIHLSNRSWSLRYSFQNMNPQKMYEHSDFMNDYNSYDSNEFFEKLIEEYEADMNM